MSNYTQTGSHSLQTQPQTVWLIRPTVSGKGLDDESTAGCTNLGRVRSQANQTNAPQRKETPLGGRLTIAEEIRPDVPNSHVWKYYKQLKLLMHAMGRARAWRTKSYHDPEKEVCFVLMAGRY